MNTMQFEFDAVVAHLFNQGQPATVEKVCRYRAGKLSCAVGCRIPDALYIPEMDDPEDFGGTSVQDLIIRTGYFLPVEIKEYRDMFSMLQQAHDTCMINEDGKFNIPILITKLEYVAEEFKLKLTIPEVV